MLLLLLGCEGDSISERIDLVVRGGQPGSVRVGDRTAILQPRGQTTLVDVGEGPYTLHIDLPDERLTLLEVPGPAVDLEYHLPFADPLVDEQIDLCFEPEPEEGFQVAAFDGVLRLPPSEMGGPCIRAPIDRPIEVVALWAPGAALDRPQLARRSIRSALHTRNWPIRPEVPLDAQLGVAIDGTPPARIEVELTLDDVRTGLIVGSGLATTGSAVGVPRPRGVEGTDGLGLRVGAVARAVGVERPVAEVAVQVPLDREGVTLSWPAPVEVSPAPRAVDLALQLRREPRSLAWESTLSEAAWVELEVEAQDGCRTQRWRVVGPAASGELVVPAWPDPSGDPLDAPVLRGRLTRVDIVGRSYTELLAPGAPSSATRAVAARVSRRAAVGAWRGGPPSCEVDPRAGVYTLRVGGRCDPAVEAPLVVVGRCGEVVGLESDAAGFIGCRRFDGDRVLGAGEPWSVTTEDDGSLEIRRADGTLRLVPVDPPPAVAAPASLLGDWFELTATRERFDRHEGTSRDGGPRVFAVGQPDEGPWLNVNAGGRFELRAAELGLTARLVAFDGILGTLHAIGSGCPGIARTLDLRVEESTLVFEETLRVDDDTDEVRIYTLRR